MNSKSSVTTILPVVLTILMLLIAWYVVAPGFRAAKQEKTNLEDEVVSLQERLAWLEDAETGMESAEATFDKLFISVPSLGNDEPNAISELEAIALRHNLQIPSIGFSEAVSDEFAYDENIDEDPISAARASISLSVEGGFDEISSFILDIENSVKFMNVKSLTLIPGTENETSLTLEIEAYSQPSDDMDEFDLDL